MRQNLQVGPRGDTITYPALAELWRAIARSRRKVGDHKGAAAAFRTARMMKRRQMARGLEEANRWASRPSSPQRA